MTEEAPPHCEIVRSADDGDDQRLYTACAFRNSFFYFYTCRHIIKHNLHLIQVRNLPHKPVWLMTITSRISLFWRIRRLVSIQLISFIKWCETRKTERLFPRGTSLLSEFGYQRIFLHILVLDAEASARQSVAETGNQSPCYDKGIMFANTSNLSHECIYKCLS